MTEESFPGDGGGVGDGKELGDDGGSWDWRLEDGEDGFRGLLIEGGRERTGGRDVAGRESGTGGEESWDGAEDPLELVEEGREFGDVDEGVDSASGGVDAGEWVSENPKKSRARHGLTKTESWRCCCRIARRLDEP